MQQTSRRKRHNGLSIKCFCLRYQRGAGVCRVSCWCLPVSLRKTQFHEPGELCAGTAYHCSSSQSSSAHHHPLAHSLLQRPQWEKRLSCPSQRFSLTPHKQYCFLSQMCRKKHSPCFKVIKLASKEKMQSISRERKYPLGILLHVNWIKKRSLSCITFAVCSESSIRKTQKSSPSWCHTYSFNTPRLPCTPAWSPVHGDSLWAFKNCISGRVLK